MSGQPLPFSSFTLNAWIVSLNLLNMMSQSGHLPVAGPLNFPLNMAVHTTFIERTLDAENEVILLCPSMTKNGMGNLGY